MPVRFSLFSILMIAISLPALAQKIVYSEVDNDDSRRMQFEVIGKVSGNFLVYKGTKSKNYISVYNNEMEQVAREVLDYIPNDKLINIDFFPYSDFTYL